MKTASIVMKFVCAALILVLGVVIFLMGILYVSGFYCSAVYVPYEKYGGDAYTGIQNAVADAANNIGDIADALYFGMHQIYMFVGIFLIIMSVYLLACAFAAIPSKKKVDKESHALSQIAQYKNLLDTGVISQEDFEAKKKDLLGL